MTIPTPELKRTTRIRLWLTRKWLRFRWWMLMGGDTNRHPQHYTVWGLVFTGLLTIGIFLVALGGSWIPRAIGVAVFILSAYILISFFMPLPLPPIWNERVANARREAAKRVIEKRLREAKPPKPTLQDVAEAQARRRLEAREAATASPTARERPGREPGELARMIVERAQENDMMGRLPLATELRDIRRKIEKVRSMAHPVYWEGFQLPAARWDEYHKELASDPELYRVVERAYVAANDVNEAVRHRRTVSNSRLIGPNRLDGLDEAYDAAGEALDALKQPRGEPYESEAQKAAREILRDEADEQA